MRADGYNRNGVVGADFVEYFVFDVTGDGAGHHYLAENSLWQPAFLYKVFVPGACGGVEQFRCRGYAVLISSYSGKEIGE